MKKYNRRSFIKTGVSAAALAALGFTITPKILRAGFLSGTPGIVSIGADDPETSIPQLLDALGGIDQFVKAGQSVGILVNSPWQHPGSYTNPDIPLVFADLCLKAGASKIICFKPVPDDYWSKSRYFEKYGEMITAITYCNDRTEVDIPNGKALKQASMFSEFMDVDVYVNIPVAKHHAGTVYSGNLKGLMGVSSSTTNRYMHSPDGEYTYDKVEYLSQCIADLNLIRKPDLCLVDAIECLLENGPRGPGETAKPNRILAGTDPVALDVYACSLIGFDPEDIMTNRFGGEHGLGESDPLKIQVLEI